MSDSQAVGARFRAAVESSDIQAARECMSDSIEFHSPVAFKPYRTIEPVMFLLTHVSQTFEDFVYIDDIHQGSSHMLRFTARVGDKALEGVDLLDIGEDGLVEKFTVMIRPLSGAIALAQAMGARIEAAGGVPDPA